MFIGVVSSGGTSQTWSHFEPETFSGNHGQGESRMCFQILSGLHLPLRWTVQYERNVQQLLAKGN